MEKKSEKKSEEKKFTYEQLEKIANDLVQQRNQIYEKLQEAQDLISGFNDVGMLLSIIERGENFDSAFIDRCTMKVQEVVTGMLDKADSMKESKNKKEVN